MTRVVAADAAITIDRHGIEQLPVIRIDDVLADPAAWRAEAAAQRYAPIGPYYPGIRAPVRPDRAHALRDELAPLIAETFDLDRVPEMFETYFSIVTTPPDRLAPIQRLPHFDGLERERLAILIYLSGADRGGTAFYRQRGTGFESVDAARYPAFEAALHAGVAQHGMPPAAYIRGDTPLYDMIAAYDAAPNRALIYRSNALHCAAIAPGTPLPPDAASGRLSINAFLADPPTI